VEAADSFLEVIAPDEAHGVERPTVGMAAQAVHRHDARVLQTPGDLGLEEKPRAAGRVGGVVRPDILERDLPIQLGVYGDGDLPETTPGVRPQHPVAGLGRPGLVHGANRVGGAGYAHGRQAGLHVGVIDPTQFPPSGGGGGQSGKALLRVLPVVPQVLRDHRVEQLEALGREPALRAQDPAQRPGLVEHPGVHGRD
jgi:hypothetical protein